MRGSGTIGAMMRFAVVDGERGEAQRGSRGACPNCGQSVVARCGEYRVDHWAHIGKRSCDPWRESETLWHRRLKSNFAAELQEVVAIDSNGERHIADIRTPLGLTIEFQHSYLQPLERRAREFFYGPNLVWVVDGTRRVRDLPRFGEGRRYLRSFSGSQIFIHPFPAECFPKDWLASRVPVFFDFDGVEGSDSSTLWGLLPGRAEGQAVAVALTRREFFDRARNRAEIVPARAWVAKVGMALRGQLWPPPGRKLRPIAAWRPAPRTFQQWLRSRRRRRY